MVAQVKNEHQSIGMLLKSISNLAKFLGAKSIEKGSCIPIGHLNKTKVGIKRKSNRTFL